MRGARYPFSSGDRLVIGRVGAMLWYSGVDEHLDWWLGVFHEMGKLVGPLRILQDIKKEILLQVVGALLLTWAFEKECTSFQLWWSVGSP